MAPLADEFQVTMNYANVQEHACARSRMKQLCYSGESAFYVPLLTVHVSPTTYAKGSCVQICKEA